MRTETFLLLSLCIFCFMVQCERASTTFFLLYVVGLHSLSLSVSLPNTRTFCSCIYHIRHSTHWVKFMQRQQFAIEFCSCFVPLLCSFFTCCCGRLLLLLLLMLLPLLWTCLVWIWFGVVNASPLRLRTDSMWLVWFRLLSSEHRRVNALRIKFSSCSNSTSPYQQHQQQKLTEILSDAKLNSSDSKNHFVFSWNSKKKNYKSWKLVWKYSDSLQN